MSIIKLAFTLGLAGLAVNRMTKGRRAGTVPVAAAANTASPLLASRDPATPPGTAVLPGPAAAAADVDAQSPNGAERLQANGLGAPADASDGGADLFSSTSQDGAEARAPGLPDFARGA